MTTPLPPSRSLSPEVVDVLFHLPGPLVRPGELRRVRALMCVLDPDSPQVIDGIAAGLLEAGAVRGRRVSSG